MISSQITKYLLMAVAFSQNPSGVEIQYVNEFDKKVDCTTPAEIHNRLAAEHGIKEKLVCVPKTEPR